MDKSWFRMILTWVVIVPDLIMSYHSLRNPFVNIEITSLALNFVATTVLFYVYMDIQAEPCASVDEGNEGEEGERSFNEGEAATGAGQADGLAFASLIEDMLVWAGLFFLLYNIVPVSVYVHSLVSKHL